MKKIEFWVNIEPTGKERPRATKSGHIYTPSKTVKAEKAIIEAYRGQVGDFRYPDRMPLKVVIRAYYKIADSDSKKVKAKKLANSLRPVVKPDYDNVGKLVCDALNGVAYKDDSQIVDGRVQKYYDFEPRLWVSIENVSI